MIRVDHTRSRPTLGCGSSASIVRTSWTIMPCRSTSWIAGAYLRRSSAVHAIRVIPAQPGRQIGAGRRGASQKGLQISMLAFEQALRAPVLSSSSGFSSGLTHEIAIVDQLAHDIHVAVGKE